MKPIKKLRIVVGQDALDHGVSCSPTDCAIAYQIKQDYGYKAVRVYGGRASINDDDGYYHYYSLSTRGAKVEGFFDTDKSQLKPGVSVVATFIESKRKVIPIRKPVQEETHTKTQRRKMVPLPRKSYNGRVFTADTTTATRRSIHDVLEGRVETVVDPSLFRS